MNKAFLVNITQQLLNDYADASGDHNPIHLDEAVALAMGLPGIIAHGMVVSGLLHQKSLELIPSLDSEKTFLKSSKTRFRGMTKLNDEVFYTSKSHLLSDSEIQLELAAVNQKEEVLVTSTFIFSKKLA